MSISNRQQEILDYLKEHGAVSVKALTDALFVSEATVRRDLIELEKAGSLKRTFGGAIPVMEANQQIPLFIRENMDSGAKNEICKQAAGLIRDGNSIFIDGSSTVNYLIKYLRVFKDITVFTHSLKTAGLLYDNHIKTYCTGGWLDEKSLVFTGTEALAFAERINIDICFISCKGMDEEGRFTDTSDVESAIRRNFIKNSKTRVFLMTENKLGTTYLHTICHASDVDYIFTDGVLPNGIRTRRDGGGAR